MIIKQNKPSCIVERIYYVRPGNAFTRFDADILIAENLKRPPSKQIDTVILPLATADPILIDYLERRGFSCRIY